MLGVRAIKGLIVTLEEAIKVLAKANIDKENNWYSWRSINEELLPSKITLPKGNQYKKNVALKKLLNKKLEKATNSGERKKLKKYYISTWGGIHGNSDETINRYSSSSPDELITMGSTGIASWSKALCIHDPEKYAIYDARVSASLNSLQIIKDTSEKVLFPVLTSRNNTIKKGTKLIRDKAKKERWKVAAEYTFYRTYLSYLSNAASSFERKLSVSMFSIEMLLFAKAEELVREAFPEGKL